MSTQRKQSRMDFRERNIETCIFCLEHGGENCEECSRAEYKSEAEKEINKRLEDDLK